MTVPTLSFKCCNSVVCNEVLTEHLLVVFLFVDRDVFQKGTPLKPAQYQPLFKQVCLVSTHSDRLKAYKIFVASIFSLPCSKRIATGIYWGLKFPEKANCAMPFECSELIFFVARLENDKHMLMR